MSDRVYGLVLAAGMSTRMGQPKALLDWGGKLLVQHQIDELRAGGVDQVIVVVGHRADEIRRLVPPGDARFVANPRYHQGRAGSVVAGAGALGRDARAIVVANIDQPVRAETIRRLLEALERGSSAVVIPTVKAKRGHPLVLDGRLSGELRHVSEEGEGLRAVLEAHAAGIEEVEVDDPWVTLDMNTPAEYEAGRPR